jgi:hypothetical protein
MPTSGDKQMKGVSEAIVQELRRKASEGASVPDLLRLLHDRLGKEAAYSTTLAKYFMDAFYLPLRTAAPIGGWAPGSGGDISDARIQELIHPEIIKKKHLWLHTPANGDAAPPSPEMSHHETIKRGRSLLSELAQICRRLQDADIPHLFGNGSLDELFMAILDPRRVEKFPSIAEFFLANKHRASLMAAIRTAISRNYSIKVTKEGITGYASPSDIQWFDDGVMLLEGKEPFGGLISLYRNGQMSYAMSLRDARAGDQLGPADFEFVDAEKTKQHFEQLHPPTKEGLDAPLNELRQLLDSACSDESKYQELFAHHPWVLGLQYSKLQRHEALDDQNIPDFTGVRITDSCRDVFEIKPPSMDVFRNDGEFSADFNAAWNQAERYLHFARDNMDYLQRKGYRFDNPKCFLVCGYNLPPDLLQKVRIKEKMNPAIHLMTFNDLLAFMESTIMFIRQLSNEK